MTARAIPIKICRICNKSCPLDDIFAIQSIFSKGRNQCKECRNQYVNNLRAVHRQNKTDTFQKFRQTKQTYYQNNCDDIKSQNQNYRDTHQLQVYLSRKNYRYKLKAVHDQYIAQFDREYKAHPQYIDLRKSFTKYLHNSCGLRKLSAMSIHDIDLLVSECAIGQNSIDIPRVHPLLS